MNLNGCGAESIKAQSRGAAGVINK